MKKKIIPRASVKEAEVKIKKQEVYTPEKKKVKHVNEHRHIHIHEHEKPFPQSKRPKRPSLNPLNVQKSFTRQAVMRFYKQEKNMMPKSLARMFENWLKLEEDILELKTMKLFGQEIFSLSKRIYRYEFKLQKQMTRQGYEDKNTLWLKIKDLIPGVLLFHERGLLIDVLNSKSKDTDPIALKILKKGGWTPETFRQEIRKRSQKHYSENFGEKLSELTKHYLKVEQDMGLAMRNMVKKVVTAGKNLERMLKVTKHKLQFNMGSPRTHLEFTSDEYQLMQKGYQRLIDQYEKLKDRTEEFWAKSSAPHLYERRDRERGYVMNQGHYKESSKEGYEGKTVFEERQGKGKYNVDKYVEYEWVD